MTQFNTMVALIACVVRGVDDTTDGRQLSKSVYGEKERRGHLVEESLPR